MTRLDFVTLLSGQHSWKQKTFMVFIFPGVTLNTAVWLRRVRGTSCTQHGLQSSRKNNDGLLQSHALFLFIINDAYWSDSLVGTRSRHNKTVVLWLSQPLHSLLTMNKLACFVNVSASWFSNWLLALHGPFVVWWFLSVSVLTQAGCIVVLFFLFSLCSDLHTTDFC